MNEKTKRGLNFFYTILFGIFIMLFVWTFAISIPIYARGIYYSQINSIERESDYDRETIKAAYDEVLDYLTLHKKFGTGKLSCSDDAKAHFADCQKLFDLNLSVMIISAVGIVVLLVLARKKIIELKNIKGYNIGFYAGIIAALLPIVVFAIAAINFDVAFVVFHKILFPGKTNWIFDSAQDEINNTVPESFFSNCGICIGCIIFAFCAFLIVLEIVLKHKNEKNKGN